MIYGFVANGRPARVIVLTQEPMAMDHVIGKPDIGGIRDLKGKRLGFSGVGAVTHFSALALAGKLGWTPDRDITLVGGSATLDALKQDKVDAILGSAMVIALASQAGFKDIGDLTTYKIPMAGSGVMALPPWRHTQRASWQLARRRAVEEISGTGRGKGSSTKLAQ